jgi:hypothetical protein
MTSINNKSTAENREICLPKLATISCLNLVSAFSGDSIKLNEFAGLDLKIKEFHCQQGESYRELFRVRFPHFFQPCSLRPLQERRDQGFSKRCKYNSQPYFHLKTADCSGIEVTLQRRTRIPSMRTSHLRLHFTSLRSHQLISKRKSSTRVSCSSIRMLLL